MKASRTISSQTIYGKSPAIQESLRTAELIAATDVTTLITGETGTGKEIFARFIASKSPRKHKLFSTINCAALPETQIQQTLFGDTPDSTPYDPGLLARTHGGTLFLDDIAELPLNIQGKLLDFLEHGKCRHTACTVMRQYNVRIIAATSKNLLQEVEAGNFRSDLYFRLNIVPLALPSLRERKDDISLLLKHFFHDLVREYKLPAPVFTSDAMNTLKHYAWPGNVRELHNFCERMLILFSGKTIDLANLPAEIRLSGKPPESFGFKLPAQGIRLEQLEVDLYEQAIQTSQGNKSAAARLLGLSRDAFLYRLKKYGLR